LKIKHHLEPSGSEGSAFASALSPSGPCRHACCSRHFSMYASSTMWPRLSLT